PTLTYTLSYTTLFRSQTGAQGGTEQAVGRAAVEGRREERTGHGRCDLAHAGHSSGAKGPDHHVVGRAGDDIADLLFDVRALNLQDRKSTRLNSSHQII